MGWRFRRSIRLFPGVRLNFSRRGVSTTIGVRGASVNVGKTGTYVNLGLPGTGISYRQKLTPPTTHAPTVPPPPSVSAQPTPALAISTPASVPVPSQVPSHNAAARIWVGIGIAALILGALSIGGKGVNNAPPVTASSLTTVAPAVTGTSAAPVSDGSPQTNPPARPVVYVQATAVNIRSVPGMSASIVGTAKKGQIFHVFATNGDWVQVGGDITPQGWVHSALLGPMP